VPEAAPGPQLVRLGLVFYGALAAAAVIWRIGFYHEPILYASASSEEAGLSPLRDIALGLLAGGLLIGVSDWMTRTTEWGERLARAMAAVLGRLSVPDALLLALASGLAEEVFFRGALQPRVGWLAASLLFGCVHFVPRREFLPWTGFALAAGLIFAALFEVTGNLIAPVVAHVLVNAVNLPWLVRRYGPGEAGGPPGAGAQPPTAY
jgi:membrane protease YdiL (CAAX protease family)